MIVNLFLQMVARCKQCRRPVLGHVGRTGVNFCTATPLTDEELSDTEPVYVEDDDGNIKEEQMSRTQLLSMMSGQSQTIEALKKEASKTLPSPGSLSSLGGAVGGTLTTNIDSLAADLMQQNKESVVKEQVESSYKGPSMPDLRRDTLTAGLADEIMQQIIARNPWLNPRGQMFRAAESSGGGQVQGTNIPCVNSFVNTTMGNTKVCTEPQPHLFLSNSLLKEKVDHKNINLPSYVLGYLNYLIAVFEGRQTKISSKEFMARLHGLANVLENCCNQF